jgi:hypothetical protein
VADTSSDKELKGGGKLGAKSKKRKQEEDKEKRSKKSAKNVIHNTQQCADFKLKEDKSWSQFAGKCLTDRAKVNESIMCTCWHTWACCFTDQGKPRGLLIDPGGGQASTPQVDAKGAQRKQVGNQVVA